MNILTLILYLLDQPWPTVSCAPPLLMATLASRTLFQTYIHSPPTQHSYSFQPSPRQGPYGLDSKVTPSFSPSLYHPPPHRGATGLMVKDDGGSTIRGKGNFILISRRFLSL